jgi:L-alanine-DL-glutamate epimerase-like enolase superfamily enzyme
MKITDVRIVHKTLRYKQEFHIALAILRQADICFIIIDTDEDVRGIGYAPGSAPVIAGEIPESIHAIVLNIFRPLLLGEDPRNIEELMYKIDKSARYNARAKAGIDFALHDLVAKRLNIPLYQFLGGKCRSEIPVMRMVGMGTPRQMVQDAVQLVNEGYKYLKLKVGDGITVDTSRLKAVREAIGNDITIVADANQAYDVKTAISAANRMSEFGLAMIEQPVPWFDFKGLATVRKNVNVMVEADESARDIHDVLRLIEMEAVDFINIKPPELGGLRNAKKVAMICEAANVGCLVGTTPGSRYIDACEAHFIASTRTISFGCEIGEFNRMIEDPVDGLEVKNGCITVPEGVGVGVKIDID